jgi:hypothetical protein
MEVGLPRETQQIDRVMEAFASRYMFCNPRIFTSEGINHIVFNSKLTCSLFSQRPSLHIGLQLDYVAY